MDALRRIVATEGVWRPLRGLNATAVGAGPAHALYFACYEKLKKTLSDVIHPGANSHLANGTIKHTNTHVNSVYVLDLNLYRSALNGLLRRSASYPAVRQH